VPEFADCLLVVTRSAAALHCPGVRHGRRYVSSGQISETNAEKTDRSEKRSHTTIYEFDSPAATMTPGCPAMRAWYHVAPHVRSLTQTVVPVRSRHHRRAGSGDGQVAAATAKIIGVLSAAPRGETERGLPPQAHRHLGVPPPSL